MVAAGKDRVAGKGKKQGISCEADEAAGRALRQGQRSCREETGHPEMRKKGQADCGLKKERPRVSGARNGYLQDRLVFVAEQLIRRQDSEAVGLEQVHGLVGLVETEDHDGTVSLTGDEGIHVFHIDAML